MMPRKRTPRKADVFDVWGHPPQALASRLSARQMAVLRRYAEMLTQKSYRLAFDCGVEHGMKLVSQAAASEWEARRPKRRRDVG